MRKALNFYVLVAALAAGCSDSSNPAPANAAPPTGNVIAATWSGSFATGAHGSPLMFTAIGEQATLTLSATAYTGAPQESVTVDGANSCSAASITQTSDSTYSITSTQSGNCTLNLSDASDAHQTFQIVVP